MRTISFLFLLLTLNIFTSQSNSNNVIPKVKVKGWDKKFLPKNQFLNGFELETQIDSCKVISYVFSSIIGGFSKDAAMTSNKVEGEALELFKLTPIGGKIYIENIKVQFADGAIVQVGTLSFRVVDDEFQEFVKETLNNYPLINDFGVYKADIRIKLEGNPSSDEVEIVKDFIQELKPNLRTVSISLIENAPTFVLNIVHDSTFGGIKSKDSIINPFFSNIKVKFVDVHLLVDQSDRQYKERLIRKAIIRNLAEFNYATWRESLIDGFTCSDCSYKLSEFDSRLINMLYSHNGINQLKEILNIPKVDIADNTLLILILSFLIFIIFFELNKSFHLFSTIEFIKNNYIRQVCWGIILAQIPVLLIMGFNAKDYSFSNFIKLELFFSVFSIIIAISILFIDRISAKISSMGLYMVFDSILIFTSFLLAYKILFILQFHHLPKLSVVNINLVYIPLTVILYRFFTRYNQNRIFNLLKEKELEIAKQKEAIVKTELLSLQSRVNPHFLYNALNSIASLIHIDKQKSEEMTLALAKLFRYNTNKNSNLLSTIQEEIEIVEIYLNVEKIRFSDRLIYEIVVDDKLSQIQIPTFLLQPLVENAIKHGISKITDKGIIKVNIIIVDNWLQINVFDNGPAFPSDIMMNYGLQSIFDKLTLLYQHNFQVNFINLPEKNISIKIKL